jgi:organic hydroperoxide reductase OsmC/OhrA
MAEIMYTAGVRVTGGRQGEAQTLDGAQEMKLRGPIERGGEGGGWNPEQLIAIGWAA